jgi:hypothetical protein
VRAEIEAEISRSDFHKGVPFGVGLISVPRR